MINTEALYTTDVARGSFVKAIDLLDAVPDDVILVTAADDIDMRRPYDCVVGRLVTNGQDYDDTQLSYDLTVCEKAANLFGGSVDAWKWLYGYLAFVNPALLEEAFAVRLMGALANSGIRDPQPEAPLDEL